MEIIIRRMNAGDGEVVTHLSRQLGYDIPVSQTINNINTILNKEDCDAFAAVYNNTVVGWITAAHTTTLESHPFCEIRGLVVDENYRKKNIGKLLIEKVKQWSKEKNCKRLRLRCNVKRTDTQTFYVHLGFKEIKEQKVFEIEV